MLKFTEVVAGYLKGIYMANNIQKRSPAEHNSSQPSPNGKGMQKTPPKCKTGDPSGKRLAVLKTSPQLTEASKAVSGFSKSDSSKG